MKTNKNTLKRAKFAILVICATILHSCNYSSKSLISQAGKVVYSNPDSALMLLSLANEVSKQDESKAEYWRIKSLAHRYKRAAMVNDSLILFSLNYYKLINDAEKIYETCLSAAEYYLWVEKKDSATNVLTGGLEYAERMNDTTFIASFLHKIAYIYLENKDYKRAVHIYNKMNDLSPNSFAFYVLALHSENKDSIDYYREKSIELALQKDDTLAVSHYLRNYASMSYSQKDYSKADAFIQRIEKLSAKYANTDLNYILLSQINIALGNIGLAQEYLDRSRIQSQSDNEDAILNLIATENVNFLLQAAIDSKNNKPVDISSVSAFNDSIISSTLRKNKILDEQRTEKENLEKRNLKLALLKYKIQMYFAISIAFLAVVLFLMYLYALKRKKRYEEVQKRIEALQRLYKEALHVKDEKENNTLLFRKTLLQQLGIMKLIAGSTLPKTQDLLLRIVNISNETVSTESLLVWKDLYLIIDSVYDNFYSKLFAKYGNSLVEKDIQLCCLLCADFSTTETGTIMQQSIQTIYQRKSSIRKKLGMDEKEDIMQFLQEKMG